jgi:CheY-like chemotaxis protein
MSINASHAMPNGGEILIKTQNVSLNDRNAELLNIPEGNYIKLIIEDSGIGMTKETLAKIFDPFFTTKDAMGSGLGLYQCYSFIKLCHGTIDVQSTINEGTTFSIYFPENTQQTEGSIENNSSLSPAKTFSAERFCILVVDDEEDIRELNCEYLRSEGFKVLSCSNAHDALNTLTTEKIDLIITDVVMPKMGGVEFISQVKQLYPEIKYLYVSGYLDLKNSDDINHIKPILFKPYKGEDLVTTALSLLTESTGI